MFDKFTELLKVFTQKMKSEDWTNDKFLIDVKEKSSLNIIIYYFKTYSNRRNTT